MPSYQNYVRNARVTDGQAKLMELAGRLERCYTVSSSYSGCLSLPENSDDGFYQISGSTSASAYTLTATHSGSQVKAECKTLTIDQTGQTTPTSECW
ncbi:type IV pilin [Halomonas sp. LR3S48]|nr:type IV pilin [Halomonas sp. LR3S48]